MLNPFFDKTNTYKEKNDIIGKVGSVSIPKTKKGGTNGVIKSLHKSAKDGRPLDTERHIKTMTSLFLKGDMEMRPDIRHYNSYIKAWVQSNYVDRLYKAQQILEWLCEIQSVDSEKNLHLRPSSSSFNMCIHAWQKSNDPCASDSIWFLFEKMNDMFIRGLLIDMPCYQTYRTVLHALSTNVKTGTASKAERVLELMKKRNVDFNAPVRLDESIYHIIMHIYSHNREVNGPKRVEELLLEMHDEYIHGNSAVKPSRLTFNTVLNTLAKSNQPGSVERAESILVHMQYLHRNGYGDCQPDTISFNTVINAYASNRRKGSDRRAFEILAAMKRNYKASITPLAKPNIRTYNACIKACLPSSNHDDEMDVEYRQHRFKRADDLFKETFHPDSEVVPDEHTIVWYLKVCDAFLNDDRSKRNMSDELVLKVGEVFSLCCENGLLHHHILDQTRSMIDMPLLARSSLLSSHLKLILQSYFWDHMDWISCSSYHMIRCFPKSWSRFSYQQGVKGNDHH